MAVFRAGEPGTQERLRQVIQADVSTFQLAVHLLHIRETEPAVEEAFLFLQSRTSFSLDHDTEEEIF